MRKQFFAALVLAVLCSLSISACVDLMSAPIVVPTGTATSQPTSTATLTPTATITLTPTRTPRPTPTLNLAATAQYESMQAKVRDYAEAGYLSLATGGYKRLKPFSDTWAKIGWYAWSQIGYTISNDFVLRADIEWASASKTPDVSGCGFVFRLQPNGDHYLFHIGTDGYIYAAHNLNKNWADMGRAAFGKASVNGKVNVSLIVTGKTFIVLVDDKLIKKFTGFDGKLEDGELAYTIISGSNVDYGTRCSFSNTDLWLIK